MQATAVHDLYHVLGRPRAVGRKEPVRPRTVASPSGEQEGPTPRCVRKCGEVPLATATGAQCPPSAQRTEKKDGVHPRPQPETRTQA